jgi:hypothetical protein
MIARIIEGTITLIILYLVLSNGANSQKVIGGIGGTYVAGVRALQGR